MFYVSIPTALQRVKYTALDVATVPSNAADRSAPETGRGSTGPRRYALGALAILVIFVILVMVFIFPDYILGRYDLTGSDATDFTLTDVFGTEFTLFSILNGSAPNASGPRVVVLDFFSLSCKPCLDQMDVLERVLARTGTTNVSIISIATDRSDSDARIRSFSENNDYNWTFARDTNGVARDYRVTAIPTLAVISRDKKVVAYRVGLHDRPTVEKDIENASDRA